MKNDYSAQVDYNIADPGKISAQQAAASTAGMLTNFGFSEVSETRGESAFVVDVGDKYVAITQEGLGTKSLITKAVYEQTGESFFAEIARDTVSTIVNDIVTVGALPFVVNAYWSSNSYAWLSNQQLVDDLITGWQQACIDSGASWGGGETQSLNGVVEDGVLELAGAGIGVIDPKSRLCLGSQLQAGDVIVLLASSGIQTNGLSLAGSVAAGLKQGYQTKLESGQTYGQALLTPSILYPKVIAELFEAGIEPHYLSHITGHGWRKIMRYQGELSYFIHTVPEVPEVLQFIQEVNQMTDEQAYSTFNMGAGFAVFASPSDVDKVVEIAKSLDIEALVAGEVRAGAREVVIEPKNIVFASESLNLRA